ncbi:alpha/beta fold hydrolase [Streptomyces sp. NPDC048611]|uniref:alpha/beta fold hydrolase n=1 Tax=Streptomyces sp. NPDC048611 TaxID=3155635 RepID=UPI003436E8E6
MDRPGLGASTPAPGQIFSNFAADMRQLCVLRGLGHPAVVGNSQGAPFALACAEEGVASALAVVSGATSPCISSLISRLFTAELWTRVFSKVLPATPAARSCPWGGGRSPSKRSPSRSRSGTANGTPATRPITERCSLPVCPALITVSYRGSVALLWTHSESILTSLFERATTDQ